METILKLLFCHLLGDYFFQSAFLSDTKGKNWYHLFVHCVLYTFPFYVCFGLCWQLGVIFGMHIIIDAAKARYHKISYVTDQILHYLLCLLYLI